MSTNQVPHLDAEQVRIGATLRVLFEDRGYKLGEFANELGISYAYLSNITAGRKRLTPQLLNRAALLLGVKKVAIVRADYFKDAA